MPRLIKKYANRRLYDTRTSAYIKQDDLKELIIGGHNVQVLDAKSQKDLTQMVLLQILMDIEEHEETSHQFFNDLILHHMIRLHQHENIFFAKAFQDYVTYLSRLTYSQNMDDFTQSNLHYMNTWQNLVQNFFFDHTSSKK